MDEKTCLETKDEVVIEFLRNTKDGKYAPIDPESLKYIRMDEQAESEEQDYYYGLS